MPAMRLPGRRGEAVAQRPMQFPPTIICPVCGLRNDITVRFCRNCGLPLGAPRDPVRGTTTKRAELPSDRGTGIAAILGLLVVVGIVGVAGYLIFRGFQGKAGPPLRTPAARTVQLVPRVRDTAVGRLVPASVDDPGGQPSGRADRDRRAPSDGRSRADRRTRARTGRHTRRPRDRVGLDLQDGGHRRSAGWQVAHRAHELERGASTDRVTLSLTRVSGTARKGTTVELAYMSPGRAASKYGVTRPGRGPRHRAHLRWARQRRHDDGRHAGHACHRVGRCPPGRSGVTHAVIGIAGRVAHA